MLLDYIKELCRPVRMLKIIRHFRQSRMFKKNRLIIGFNSIIKNVNIGDDVFIGANCSLVNTTIGSNSYCNTNTHIRNCTIGKFTSIGSNVNICIGEHPVNLVSTHPAFYSNNKAFKTFADKMYFAEIEHVEVGNDVWIGSNATIMNNVKIGDGAIVAYGAIVTKDVEPYTIVGGIPAHHIKYRLHEDIIVKLLKIRWWDLDEKFLQNKFELFNEPQRFITYYEQNSEYIESIRKK